MHDTEQLIHDDLWRKEISRRDAVARLVEMRYFLEDAQCMVEEWIELWEYQKDHDEEREQGWTV